MTFEDGRIRTCRFPRLSALHMAFRASLNTLIRTMLNPEKKSLMSTEAFKTIAEKLVIRTTLQNITSQKLRTVTGLFRKQVSCLEFIFLRRMQTDFLQTFYHTWWKFAIAGERKRLVPRP